MFTGFSAIPDMFMELDEMMRMLVDYLCLMFLSFFGGVWLLATEHQNDAALLVLFAIVGWTCSNQFREDLFGKENHAKSQGKQK